jgi:ATP-dependent exoDNAse (exonuclease V) alpha subunit
VVGLFPFKWHRRQFPVRLAFAMSIHKAQGQTLDHVGLYLEKDTFAHGQLYVAVSRVRNFQNLKICIPPECDRRVLCITYKEVLTSSD